MSIHDFSVLQRKKYGNNPPGQIACAMVDLTLLQTEQCLVLMEDMMMLQRLHLPFSIT